jgi:hypothetical protein
VKVTILVVLSLSPFSDATQIQPIQICVTLNKVARVSSHYSTHMGLPVVLYTVSCAVFACCVTQKTFSNVNEPAYLHQDLPKFPDLTQASKVAQ